MTDLQGTSIIGHHRGALGNQTLQGFNPASGENLLPIYHSASLAEVDEAAQLAHGAFATYSQTTAAERARFLRRIAENIEALGDELIARAHSETALPEPRLCTETARTCNQLRLFADVVEEGSWVDARIDHGDRDRKPVPKPDVRSMFRPIGPVVVFGASNFPLAFSVAGGDTASAFAAGDPVIVKAHPAHPGTSELVGLAISEAVRDCGLHEGVFSLLYDAGNEVALALVKHPLIKAGGFTGSRAGGRALFEAAVCTRPDPIPFYAEMSSVNPVVILPGALRDQIASGLHASVTLGAGQFCTNPGLILLPEDSDAFVNKLGDLMTGTPDQTMLTSAISSNYRTGVASRMSHPAVEAVAVANAALFKTKTTDFIAHPELADELFGPSTLVITYTDRQQLIELINSFEGQLTATIHGSDEDLVEYSDVVRLLETKAGRLVFNGFPTGVEVCHAMVHGGPYPATSEGRSSSVGTRAIYRFARQVCYQDFPNNALPLELRDENPLGIRRLVDGQ